MNLVAAARRTGGIIVRNNNNEASKQRITMMMSLSTMPSLRSDGDAATDHIGDDSSSSMKALWMPFTPNKLFKSSNTRPRMLSRAKGMYYWTSENRRILDGTAGLWCSNAGHCPDYIVEATQKQLATLDFGPSFLFGHAKAFEYATRLVAEIAPPNGDLDHVFFTMCGSTSVDTAMKIALAYHGARGNASKFRFIGRERGYHGVGFGGISVGGIPNNRKQYANCLLPGVDHLKSTYHRDMHAYTRGQPSWGAHLADELQTMIATHGASTIAAVIMEPVPGSTGVLPPPAGYLDRIREICTRHDILLIFDEVITGFGRLGKGTGSEYFNVTPDLITCAKGLTNAMIPAGAVFTKGYVYDTLMTTTPRGVPAIELFHGYTYSCHPVAMAAGLATLDYYRDHNLFERATAISPHFEESLHSLKGLPHVIDIRNLGLMGAVELESIPGCTGQRGYELMERCFEDGVMVRQTADTIALSPPLIVSKEEVDIIVDTLAKNLRLIE
jgi:beta-alanine--pyruvate transaminase